MLLPAFSDLKDLLEASLHLSRDALHVHVGLILFLTGAVLIRSERRFVHSLACLLAVCLVGELFDLAGAYSEGARLKWMASAKDIVNTMLWPALWVFAGPLLVRLPRRGSSSIEPHLQSTGK